MELLKLFELISRRHANDTAKAKVDKLLVRARCMDEWSFSGAHFVQANRIMENSDRVYSMPNCGLFVTRL